MSFAPECTATPSIPAGASLMDSWTRAEYPSSQKVFVRSGIRSPEEDGDIVHGLGVPIVFAPDESNNPREATIGGFISMSDGTIYGVTTAHKVQKNNYEVVQSRSPQVRTFDYNLDRSNPSDFKDEDQHDDRQGNETSHNPSTSSDVSSAPLPSQARAFWNPDSPTDNAERSSFVLHPIVIGEVAYTSEENGSLGLDWALIELNHGLLQTINSLKFPSRGNITTTSNDENLSKGNREGLTIRGIEAPLSSPSPGPRKVLAATGASGVLSGILSGTSTSILLPGTSKMQEVWNVHLDGVILEGDCGSFVIDEHSGNLYGHVVAGAIGTGFVYIVPAYKVQLDIQRRSNERFSITTIEDLEKYHEAESEKWPFEFAFLSSKDQDNISDDGAESAQATLTSAFDTATSLTRATSILSTALSSIPKKLLGVNPVPKWPNPELSIGKPVPVSLGRDRVWEVIGPAQEIFTAIAPLIGDLLELEVAHPQVLIHWQMYMVGRNTASARPTIVIQSPSKEDRQLAMTLIKKSSILDKYPGIRLANASKMPHLKQDMLVL